MLHATYHNTGTTTPSNAFIVQQTHISTQLQEAVKLVHQIDPYTETTLVKHAQQTPHTTQEQTVVRVWELIHHLQARYQYSQRHQLPVKIQSILHSHQKFQSIPQLPHPWVCEININDNDDPIKLSKIFLFAIFYLKIKYI